MAAGEWGPVDVVTVVLYFVAVACIGGYFSRKMYKQQKEKGVSTESYFLAGHSVPWWAVAASLFSANIGAEHFVALAGTAAVSGIATAWYEWGAIVCVLLLGHYFLPVYLTSKVTTMPEFIERRFNPYCRTFLVIFSLFMYMVTKIAATLYAGQLIITNVSSFNGFEAVVILIIGTAVYTLVGGLAAVVYTEVLQTVVLVAGGVLVLVLGLVEVGGFQGLKDSLPPGNDLYFDLLRPADDADFPWPGMVFGFYCVASWYWATDQVIVQRALAARNMEQGQAGCVGAAFLKILPGFLMVVPGMIGRALFEREGLATAASDSSTFDTVYPWLVMNVLPVNTRGLVVAAMLSALMGHLAAVFNSCATIFAENVYLPGRPNVSEAQVVWVGRATVIVMAVLSLLWLPVIPLFSSQLFYYIQEPPSFMAPPILAMFFWGTTFRFVTAEAVSWTITLGVGAGFIRFVMQIMEGYGMRNGVMDAVVSLQFLEFALVSFLACSLLMVLISYLRPDNRVWDSASERLLRRPNLYWELMAETDRPASSPAQAGATPSSSPSPQASPKSDSGSQAVDNVPLPLRGGYGKLGDLEGAGRAVQGAAAEELRRKRIWRKRLINVMSVVALGCFLGLIIWFK